MAKSSRSLVVWAGAASVSISAVIAAIGIQQISTLSGALSESTKTLEALRRHVEGDMLHDGLRADVLAALSNPAETGLPLEQVAADTAEHAAWFRRLVEENRTAGLSPEIQSALAGVEPALDAYIEAATEIVRLAGTDRAAAVAALPRFQEKFEALEVSMEATSDQIQLTANQDAEAAHQVSAWAPIILIAALAGAIALLITLLALANKHVIRPISDLTDTMAQLSNDKLDIEPPHQGRQDELGHIWHGPSPTSGMQPSIAARSRRKTNPPPLSWSAQTEPRPSFRPLKRNWRASYRCSTPPSATWKTARTPWCL
jgi:methyl-accepting chemotaxis protein